MTIDGIVILAFCICSLFAVVRNVMPQAYGLALRIIRLIPKMLLWIFVGKTQFQQSESRKKQGGTKRYVPRPQSKRR